VPAPFDRRVAPPATLSRSGQRCAGRPEGPRRGIDMSLRTHDPKITSRRPHWLLAFTALFSRSGSPTTCSPKKPHSVGGTRTPLCSLGFLRLSRRPRAARNTGRGGSGGVNRSRRSGPRGQPACGARDKTSDPPLVCQTVRLWGSGSVWNGSLHDDGNDGLDWMSKDGR
jgi:hypothetical protein